MSKVITNCPKCGSACLWFKPDGSILCTVCMTKIDKENFKVKKLQFIGIDYWSRPVYQEESGRLWKNVNLGNGELSLHSALDNKFEGEPDIPIKGEYEIIKTEDIH